MSDFILHATSRDAWSAAQERGEYLADSLAGQGFIHCSKVDQIMRVVNLVFAGGPDLLLLVIDPRRLTSELRWEPGEDVATELFPHIYGPINLGSVIEVLELKPGRNGKFHLPEFQGLADR